MTAARDTGSGTALDALQTALAAEHAAVYGYGVAGAHLRGSAQAQARAAHDAHRAHRDQLSQLIHSRKGEPAGAAPAYSLPFPVASGAAARRLATRLEDGVAAAYADLVAAAGDQALRQLAARALQEAAVRAVRWRGRSLPFPGLTEVAATQPTPTPGDQRTGPS
jgi:hypothetical protein